MNELTKMGFTYEVTHFAPDGKEVEKQIAHNIMINEGITNFLATVFNLGGKCFKRFIYGFMESQYVPLPTDTMAGNNALDLYEVDYNETILSPKTIFTNPLISHSVTKGKDGVSVEISKGTFTFWGKKTLTGVVLIHDYNDKFHGSSHEVSEYYLKQMLILSAARFDNPMQIEPNGKVSVKSNFIILSA